MSMKSSLILTLIPSISVAFNNTSVESIGKWVIKRKSIIIIRKENKNGEENLIWHHSIPDVLRLSLFFKRLVLVFFSLQPQSPIVLAGMKKPPSCGKISFYFENSPFRSSLFQENRRNKTIWLLLVCF